MKLVERTRERSNVSPTMPGWRLNLPLWARMSTEYRVESDEFVHGIHLFCLSVSVSRLRIYGPAGGWEMRVAWSWIPTADVHPLHPAGIQL